MSFASPLRLSRFSRMMLTTNFRYVCTSSSSSSSSLSSARLPLSSFRFRSFSSAGNGGGGFVFTPNNFINPLLRPRHPLPSSSYPSSSSSSSPSPSPSPSPPPPLSIVTVPLQIASDSNREFGEFGHLIRSADERTVDKNNFQIVKWPLKGWRSLDPHTGDEGGTVEGDFSVRWSHKVPVDNNKSVDVEGIGDYFYGENHAISSINNKYLDGLAIGALERELSLSSSIRPNTDRHSHSHIYLWMSDYHPDGAQLFWPRSPIPFVVCLGPSARGDDIRPEDMRAFLIPKGCGVYFHPGTWHNGVYIHPKHAPATFLTRQGKVHARVSVSWLHEFNTLLRVPLDINVE